MPMQNDLFEIASDLPDDFQSREEIMSTAQEARFMGLPRTAVQKI
jgi:hypothetical protein